MLAIGLKASPLRDQLELALRPRETVAKPREGKSTAQAMTCYYLLLGSGLLIRSLRLAGLKLGLGLTTLLPRPCPMSTRCAMLRAAAPLRRPLPRWPRWLCRPWTQRPAEADSAASPGPPLRERPRPVPSSRPPGPPSGPGVRQSVRQNRREAKEETSETPLRQSCSGHDRNTAFSTAISPASLLQWLSHQTANYKISTTGKP